MQDRHQIGCYYFPNYHVDPRNEKLHGPGWTEWELVRHATPRFAGHQQPKFPLWGYGMEDDPAVMARKIEAAADHGIDFFIFDWYYYNDGPFLARAVENGFTQALNSGRMKFCCMWANHDWVNLFPCGRQTGRELLYPGKVTPETFRAMSRVLVERYFPHPSHFAIDGFPYFSIYDLSTFLQNFGSVKATRTAMDEFRSTARAAGFPGVHLNVIACENPVLRGEKVNPNFPELLRELGFDSVTSYVWIHHVPLDQSPLNPYPVAMEKYLEYWDGIAGKYEIPYYPNVTMGWDSSPRFIQSDKWLPVTGYPNMNLIEKNTPENFRIALEKVRARLDAMRKPSIVTINSWNEWTEGSYLEPDQQHGLAYLEAVKSTFGVRQ